MVVKAHIIVNGLIMHSPGGRIINDELWPASSSNSVGVAISEPRVEVRSASTLGIYIIRCSYSVRVAISRRRYSQSDIIRLPIPAHHPAAGNAYG